MSLEHCAALVAAGDPDRFLTAMTAPPARRGALLALYAFNLELARAPWASREPMIGEMRLRFWHDALDALLAGRPPPAHPVAEALAPVVPGLPAPLLRGLVEARAADLSPGPYADVDAQIDRTAVALMTLAARALGAPADAAAACLGHAHGAAILLRALPAFAARGHWPLPGAAAEDWEALRLGRTTPGLARHARALAERALGAQAAGARAARAAPRAALPALRAGWRSRATLGAALRPGLDLLRDLGPPSEARRRASLLWRVLAGGV